MCPPRAKQTLVLRQPPPPIRTHNGASPIDRMMGAHLNIVPTLTTTEEENNTERGVGKRNSSYVSGQTRPYYSRRCKMKMLKPTNIESLPVDVIFEILVRVPAQDIYDATQLVCRKWYKIIHTRDFIHSHLRQSTCGLLARDLINFIASEKSLCDISKVNYRFKGNVLSSCNGLVLEVHDNFHDVYITNPATKQNFGLPPFFTDITPYGSALAYAATSMEYKVVRVFFHYDFKLRAYKFEPQDDCVAILTVGVDKEWACRVNTQHLSLTVKKLLWLECPLTTEGFVHWAKNDSHSEHVLTLNVETEIITPFCVPSCLRRHDGKKEVIYLAMGSYLSLLISLSEYSWEVWEMKPETGEWTKMPSMIDLEAEFANARSYIPKPVGWSKPREVLVFSVSKGPKNLDCCFPTPICFAYNVHTRGYQKFALDCGINNFLVHRNSLVWMDG